MPLDDHLLRSEQILASASAVSGGILYATNQRVLRYNKGMFNENVESLSYAHIVSASYEKKSFLWAIIIGVVFLFLAGMVYYIVSSIHLYGVLQLLKQILTAVIALCGIALVLIGIFYREQFYQIKAVGLSDSERATWRTANADPAAKTFARFIQDQINSRELQSNPPPPPPYY